MPLIETTGAASSRGFGQFARSVAANYIEDVFQTWLYTGNSSTNTITNGIDLSTKGGMVWIKNRGSENNVVQDTLRGIDKRLVTNLTDAQNAGGQLTSWNTNGFTISGTGSEYNLNANNFVSWTFRKQPKFFDVVTYTGNGSSLRSLPHSLGSTPGFIIVKKTSAAGNWGIYHRSLPALGRTVYLNSTIADSDAYSGFTPPTASIFYVGGGGSGISGGTVASNENGATYVAYLFAHDAGGFGASGTDNVISCGYAASGTTVNLGWEPQWILIKDPTQVDDWRIFDSMRGVLPANISTSPTLAPNSSAAEANSTGYVGLTSTGFYSGTNNIYIAIRRGPMRTPTTGTSVFSPIASSAATGTALTTSFPVDAQIFSLRTGTTNKNNTYDRLRGVSSNTTESGVRLITNSTAAETAAGNETRLWDNTGFQMPSTFGGASTVFWNFRRAPGFFDVVCYTGTGVARTVNHNLGVVPEMMIVKSRTASVPFAWAVYVAPLGNSADLSLNNANSPTINDTNVWNATNPTSTVFSVGISGRTNSASDNFVAYLFASLPGISKVGSYTGNGSSQTINCGFTGGARFVLIKRTDSTGDWYVWDSARGIVAGNDPYLLLNSTAAEVTSTDYVDTFSSGFEISSTAPAAINANGGTFIFLAIA